MIFDREERFCENLGGGGGGGIHQTQQQQLYIPPSTLTSKGTKIVDDWCKKDDAPRFDTTLSILPNGLIVKGKKQISNDEEVLNLPDMSRTKKESPTYSFSKGRIISCYVMNDLLDTLFPRVVITSPPYHIISYHITSISYRVIS